MTPWLPSTWAQIAEVAPDPVSNLSSYGFAGTIIAIFALAGAFLYRTQLKSWDQQRLDLIARIDQANARADRAEDKRDEAIQALQRAIDEMRSLSDTTSGRGMELLQRALTAVAEAAAREKSALEENDRLRREIDRLNARLDDRVRREIDRRAE